MEKGAARTAHFQDPSVPRAEPHRCTASISSMWGRRTLFITPKPWREHYSRLCQWVKSLFPHAPNGCLSGGFPNNPFQSLQRRLLLVKRSGRPNGPIQKEPKTHQFRNSCLHGRIWLLHARFWLLHAWFWMFPGFVHRQFRPENGFSGRKRAENGRQRAENGPKNRPPKIQCSPRKKKRGVRPPKSKPFFRVPFLIMRKVLNQG